MPTVRANGKKFTFPEGTTDAQIGEAIDSYFAENPSTPAAPQPAPAAAPPVAGPAMQPAPAAAPTLGPVPMSAPASATPILDEQLRQFAPQDDAEARRRQFEKQAEENSFWANFKEGAADVLPSMWLGAQQAAAERQIDAARNDITNTHPEGRQAALGEVQRPMTEAQARLERARTKLDELRGEEERRRERMDPIGSTGGGIVGNLAANIALTAPLEVLQAARAVGAVAKGGRAALTALRGTPAAGPTGLKLLAKNLAREGGTGAATGFLQPTVAGESRENNALLQGALGAVGGAVGTGLQSEAGQKLAGKITDYNPLFMFNRLNKRNEAARAEVLARNLRGEADILARNTTEKARVELANKTAKALNAQDKAAHTAAQKAEDDAYKAAVKANQERADRVTAGLRERALQEHAAKVKAAEDAAAYANLKKDLAERERVHLATTARDAHMEATRQQLGQYAGWGGMPADQLGAKSALAQKGVELGNIVKPYSIDPSGFVEKATKLSKGLDDADQKLLERIGKDVADKSTLTGKLSGQNYSTTRRELVDMLRNTSGDTRTRIQELLETLDDSFDAVVPKDVSDQLKQTRSEYAIGHRIANSSSNWNIETGLNLDAARKKLSNLSGKADAKGVNAWLVKALKSAPEKPKGQELLLARPQDVPLPIAPQAVAPAAVPPAQVLPEPTYRDMETHIPEKYTPEKFKAERLDWGKIGVMNALGASTLGPWGMAGLYGAALLAPAMKHAPTRKTTAALLRSLNARYGSVLAPGEAEEGD